MKKLILFAVFSVGLFGQQFRSSNQDPVGSCTSDVVFNFVNGKLWGCINGSWSSLLASSGLTVGSTGISSGTNGRVLYDNAAILGELSLLSRSIGGTNNTAGATPQLFFGTAAPGSVTGNLPGDLFSDTTNHNDYWCNATSGTATPACTSVTTGGWTLLNGGGGGGGVSGSGTTGYFSKWTGATAIGNSSCDEGITTANVVTCTFGLASPSWQGTGSNPYINFPSNTGHTPATGDFWNNAGSLKFSSDTVCLQTAANCGGGGGTRTINLPLGGGAITSNSYPAWGSYGTGVSWTIGSATLGTLQILFSNLCGSSCTAPDPFIVSNFWIPDDYASGASISLYLIDSGGVGGNTRWIYGLVCQATGTAWATSYTNTATSATTTFAGATDTVLVAGTAIATSGCTAGQIATLRIYRDNTVGTNAAAAVGLTAVKLTYHSNY